MDIEGFGGYERLQMGVNGLGWVWGGVPGTDLGGIGWYERSGLGMRV